VRTMLKLIEAKLAIRHVGCVIAESLVDGASATQVSSDRDADIIVMSGRDEHAVDRFYAKLVETQDHPPEVLHRGPTSLVVRGRNPEWGVVSTIARAGATILWPATWQEGIERYTVLVKDRAALQALLAALAPLGPVEVEHAHEVSAGALSVTIPLAGFLSDLTEKQLAALQLAIASGYYDSPRRVTTEDLAARVGIARTTFEEHLRKAEQRALRHFAGAVTTHPALAKESLRGKGRPRKNH
jgi:predicted DNA binding protein